MKFAILLSVFTLILVYLYLLKQKKFLKRKEPPGPTGLPIIGNLHQFDSAKPHEYLWKLSRKHGPVMKLKFGCKPILVISSAKSAEEALKTHDLVFSGRPPLLGQQKLSYNGRDLIFSPYDEYNKEIRKIFIVHLFSLKRAQSFRSIREDEISLSIQEISKLSFDSRVIDLSSMMINFTSSLICRIAFGKKFDKKTQETKKFQELLEEGQALLAGLFVSDYIPWLGWIDNFSGMKKRLEKNFNDFDSFYQDLIDEHLDPNRPDIMKGDILDILIGLKDQKLSGFDLTWDHIKSLLMNVFIAASDTSAAAIVWTMTSLMKKPSIMKRVQKEIRENVGSKHIVDEDVLQNLLYLKAIVKESMRLHPPAPLLVPRETTENCIINGCDIKAKTLVFINGWAIARDPAYWENPEEFNPKRFLNSNIEIKGKDFNVIPFGTGRRICPGMNMGITTTELGLANLLYSFDWELPSGVNIENINMDVLPGLTMHKKDALCLVATKYHNKLA